MTAFLIVLGLLFVAVVIGSSSGANRRASTTRPGPPVRSYRPPLRAAPPAKAPTRPPARRSDFDPTRVELNDEFTHALNLVENEGESLFLTGRAGTGKSTFVRYLMATTKKRAAVLAPTGVAALAAGGQTIHSFFRFPAQLLDPSSIGPLRDSSAIRKLDVLVLDEASMISANLLDAVDRALRVNRGNLSTPFGGVQVLLVGDLFQLAPVVRSEDRQVLDRMYRGPFFFHAPVFGGLPIGIVSLETVYRQADAEFVHVLDCVREAHLDADALHVLNQQVREYSSLSSPESYVTLTPWNDQAHRINLQHLGRLQGNETVYEGVRSGKFERDCLAEVTLRLKPGARVIMLNNDKAGRWVNGSLGAVVRTAPRTVTVTVEGGTWDVEPYVWESVSYRFDPETNRIRPEVVGTFRQLPLKLSWALTIHKSQGQTIDRVYVDLGRGAFAHGQTYVALSRCRSLQGLALSRPIRETDLILDESVFEYRDVFHPVAEPPQLSAS